MDGGFTISNSQKFLESGSLRDTQVSRQSPSSTSLSQLQEGKNTNENFADTLKIAIDKVNELQLQSNKQSEMLATGKTDNIADVMLASEKADIALRLMMQVRNKIIDAYQEIMKMQV